MDFAAAADHYRMDSLRQGGGNNTNGRAAIAADVNADVFLRLRCNNRDQESVQGIGIFCLYGSAYAKAIAERDGWQAMENMLLKPYRKALGK